MATVIDLEREPTSLSDTTAETLADLVQRLGDVPLERIRLKPPLGTATENDLLTLQGPSCELVDGVLVEKAMGYFECRLGSILLVMIEKWLEQNPIGYCNGESAYTRLQYGLVRIPDVSFVRWDRVGDRTVPRDPICGISPNLAVEVLSPKNTKREIERKRKEYFAAQVQLVWIVDPQKRTVKAWSSINECKDYNETGELDGGTVLPGFRLSISEWFRRAEGPGGAAPAK